MYYLYGKINRGHGICPLYGGSPLLGESVNRGFTVLVSCHSCYSCLCSFCIAILTLFHNLFLYTCRNIKHACL